MVSDDAEQRQATQVLTACSSWPQSNRQDSAPSRASSLDSARISSKQMGHRTSASRSALQRGDKALTD